MNQIRSSIKQKDLEKEAETILTEMTKILYRASRKLSDNNYYKLLNELNGTGTAKNKA